MNVNEIVVTELRGVRAQLVAQRDELSAAIAEIDMIIGRRNKGEHAPQPQPAARPSRRDGTSHANQRQEPPMADVIYDLIRTSRVPVRANFVSDAVAARGWASSSVRKTLTTMVEQGLLERAGRGLYRAVQTSGDAVDAASPDPVATTVPGGEQVAPPPTSAVPDDHIEASAGRNDRDHHRIADDRMKTIQF